MYYLFCVVIYIVCVYMCTVLLPPGGYPFAVNKYIISYQYIASKSCVLWRNYPGILHTAFWTEYRTVQMITKSGGI